MPKTCEKPFYENIRVVLCKNPLQKTPNIREMRPFSKSTILKRLQSRQRLQPLQNGQSGSKIKNATNLRKTILQEHQTCSVPKTAIKNTNIREMRPILKSAILQRPQPMQSLYPLQDGQFGSKIKNAKNMRKTILQEHQSFSVQKPAPKETKYTQNETILKKWRSCKGYSPCKAHAKAITFAKCPVLGQKLKVQKHANNITQKGAFTQRHKL